MSSSAHVTDTELPELSAICPKRSCQLVRLTFQINVCLPWRFAPSVREPTFHLPEFIMRKSLLLKKLLFSTVVARGSLAGLFAYPEIALARVKLITLPVRERVEIQLDNASATLVEEERVVPW